MLESVAQNFQIHQDLTIWAVWEVLHKEVSLVVFMRSKILFRIVVVSEVNLSKVDLTNKDSQILDSKQINLVQMEISHTTMCARIMPMMILTSRRQFKFKNKEFLLDSLCQAKEVLILLKISTSTYQLQSLQVCDREQRFNARCSFHRMGSSITLVSLLDLKVLTKNSSKSKHTARFSSGI